MAFPADLADPDPVAAPAFPDGPLFPRAAPAVPSDVLVDPEGLVARAVPVDLVAPGVRAVLVARVDPVAVGPAARVAPRDLTTAARPLPRPRCGWPRRPGAAPPV